MNALLTPERIYNGVLKGDISKNLALDQLLSLIEGSNVPQIRSKAIEIIKKLNFRELEIFKIIENVLLADENVFVRNSAVKLVFTLFQEQGINSLLWVVKNEVSPLILSTILNMIGSSNESFIKPIILELNTVLERISLKLGISKDEAKFILDLDAQFALLDKNSTLDLKSYSHFIKIHDFSYKHAWLEIHDNHITSLTLNIHNWLYVKKNLEYIDSFHKLAYPEIYLNILRDHNIWKLDEFTIPESIDCLQNLKLLNLSRNGLLGIPNSIGHLKNLEILDLSYNNLITIPKAILSLKALRTLNISYNKFTTYSEEFNEFLDSLADFTI
jgi:hypothetical protein